MPYRDGKSEYIITRTQKHPNQGVRMDRNSNRLKPTLGLFDATAIGVGAIIGSGIFVVTGIAAGVAGPGIVVSMAIAAVVSLLTALSFVQLTAWQPMEGGVYEFASKLFSRFAGFLAGWMWIASYILIGPAVSLSFSYYFTALFPVADSRLLAAAVCVVFTLLNYIGVRHSAELNNVLVSAKVLILLVFSAAGVPYLEMSNFVPFMPSTVGVLQGAFLIFFAYGGFGRIAVLGEEVKDARHTIPRSIVLALVASTIIYLMVGTVAIGLIGAQNLGKSQSPLADAIRAVGIPILTYVVSLGGLLATASVLLTSILGVSRMAFIMAREGDLPTTISRLHSKYNTPYLSILIVGTIMSVLALFADLESVVAVSTFGLLFNYALANVSALKLNEDARLYPRAVPVAGLATCLALMAFVQPSALATGVACLVIGAIYRRVRVWRTRN